MKVYEGVNVRNVVVVGHGARFDMADVLAFRLTALGRGRTWVLFPLCVLFAAATTIFSAM